MYPNLRYAFYDLFGLDIPLLALVQSYGFFLAMAFLVSTLVLIQEMKRREKAGLMKGIHESVVTGLAATPVEIATNAIIGFLIGWKVGYALFNGAEVASNGIAFLASMKGNIPLGVLAAGAFGYLKYYEKKKEQLPEPKTTQVLVMPHQRVADLVILSAISGIAGAKMLYHLEYWDDFVKDPIGELTSPSGLTVYGGLIMGFLVVSWYVRRKQIDYRQMLDSAAPTMILAYGVGRLGCHVSGDGDWGIVNTMAKPGWLSWLPEKLWAYKYPNNILGEGVPMADCGGFTQFGTQYCNELEFAVFPTPIYETLMCLIIFFILRLLRTKVQHIPGMLFGIYLLFNGAERFTIEKIRVNDKYQLLGMNVTQAEVIATCIFLVGVAFMAWLWFSHRQKQQQVQG
jgi:prolipoprotein diacylglyceryltransferase